MSARHVASALLPLAVVGHLASARADEPALPAAPLSAAQLDAARGRVSAALDDDVPFPTIVAEITELLGPPATPRRAGLAEWASAAADRCLLLSLHPGIEAKDVMIQSWSSGTPERYWECLDTATGAPRGTAAEAAKAAAAAEEARWRKRSAGGSDRSTVLLAIAGLGALAVVIVGIVIWSFRSRRKVWARFAAAHGLTATGLGYNQEPKVSGRYRGVTIEVGLGLVGRMRVRGKGTFALSDTRACARLEPSLPAGLWLTSRDLGAHRQGLDALGLAAAPLVAAFERALGDGHQAYADHEEVSASVPAMPASVEALQALVDRCVDVVLATAASRGVG